MGSQCSERRRRETCQCFGDLKTIAAALFCILGVYITINRLCDKYLPKVQHNASMISCVTSTERPGTLTPQKSTCSKYAREGQDVRCECSYPSTQGGSPPAQLSWVESSESSATLEIRDVKRDQNGTRYTCRSVWGPQGEVVHSLNYTLLVACE